MMGGRPLHEDETILQTDPPHQMIKQSPRSNPGRTTPRVQFDSIEVIELPLTMGDHPYCTSGCAITTEWEAQHRRTYKLDTFERNRLPRQGSCQKLSAAKREILLQDHGWSREDIQFHHKKMRERKEQEDIVLHRINRWSAE